MAQKILIYLFCIACVACGNNSATKNENTSDAPASTTKIANKTTRTPSDMIISPADYPGSVAYAVFAHEGKTIFYYNVDTQEGSITINNKIYNFTEYKHTINQPDYFLKSGNDLSIRVYGTKFSDYENPEPGILKGSAAKIVITLGNDSLIINNKIDVTDGTNAD
jgi:hypothetical protein